MGQGRGEISQGHWRLGVGGRKGNAGGTGGPDGSAILKRKAAGYGHEGLGAAEESWQGRSPREFHNDNGEKYRRHRLEAPA